MDTDAEKDCFEREADKRKAVHAEMIGIKDMVVDIINTEIVLTEEDRCNIKVTLKEDNVILDFTDLLYPLPSLGAYGVKYAILSTLLISLDRGKLEILIGKHHWVYEIKRKER